MFLADDILMFPFKSLMSVFQEIHKAALAEIEGEAQNIRTELAELYLLLEQGVVDEASFDERERLLLDRLDAIEDRDAGIENEDEDDEDDEEEQEEDDDEEEEDEDDDEESEDDPS